MSFGPFIIMWADLGYVLSLTGQLGLDHYLETITIHIYIHVKNINPLHTLQTV